MMRPFPYQDPRRTRSDPTDQNQVDREPRLKVSPRRSGARKQALRRNAGVSVVLIRT